MSNYKHGHGSREQSPTYVSWYAMKSRCDNAAQDNFAFYGGRGIKYCPEWADFESFLRDMGERPAEKTLDRYPDPNGDYCKENCRWATKAEQSYHGKGVKLDVEKVKAIRRFYAVGNVTQKELAEAFSVSVACIKQVVQRRQWRDV